MWPYLAGLIALVLAFLFGASRRTAKDTVAVKTLDTKIDTEKTAAATAQADADAKTKEYIDALNKFVPNGFHDDGDDSSGGTH